jgi:ferric-dicitrate binding protein FerR (iron transport regulator)
VEEYHKKLVNRYLSKTCTDQELEVFAHLLKEGKLDSFLNEDMEAEVAKDSTATVFNNRQKNIYRYVAAASILFLMSAGFYFYNSFIVDSKTKIVSQVDIAPGRNKAFLTLADGVKIDLDEAVSGEVARQSGLAINKLKEGQLSYAAANIDGKTTVYNIITTPSGGQYKVILSDGTAVWLNSGSSIRFPAIFSNQERVVEVTGEAYFEVAKKLISVRGNETSKNMPFIVKTKNQEIQVLGTHFNVNAYEDEAITKTTLLEGSIKIKNGSQEKLLSPNEQSIVAFNNNIKISSADTEEAVAWKNGYFQFKDEGLESILRKISRWYNVEVVYDYKPSHLKFGGMVSREKNISAILKIMESTGNINFKIEGRRLTVMP